MLTIGCWILTIWSAANLAISAKIIVDTLLRDGHTPALFLILTEADVAALSSETIATLDSIAVFANGLNVGFCILALCLIWRGLFRKKAWCLAGLTLGFFAAWFAGAAADFVVGNVAIWVSVVSLTILAAGLASSGIGLLNSRTATNLGG